MNTKEKIDYIIDNEGCEYADGLECLLTFSSYCGIELDVILPFIEEDVDRIYEELLEEEEERNSELWKYKFIPTGNMFEDKYGTLYFLTVDGPYDLVGNKSIKEFLPDDLVKLVKLKLEK
jgi:hypothetical protein